MARAWHDWTIRDLADAAGVSHATIANIEAGRPVRPALLAAVKQSLEETGIQFTDDGVFVDQRGKPLWEEDEYFRFLEITCEAIAGYNDPKARDIKSYLPGLIFWRRLDIEFIIGLYFYCIGEKPTPEKIYTVTREGRNINRANESDGPTEYYGFLKTAEEEIRDRQVIFEIAFEYVQTEMDGHLDPFSIAQRLSSAAISKTGSASDALRAARANPERLFSDIPL